MNFFKKVTYNILFIFIITNPGFVYAQNQAENGSKSLSLDRCVLFALSNSFEIKMAKLDLYIAQTDLLYSQAVYDTILSGSVSYSKDKREQLSVFSSDTTRKTNYSAGIAKKLITGTEVNIGVDDKRLWDQSAYVTQNPSHTAELSVSLKQPIGKNAFGYNDWMEVSLTKLAIKNAQLQEKDRIELLIADVMKAYWQVVFAAKALEMYQDMLEKAKRLHQTNIRNFEMGIIEKVDFLASESNVSSREIDVLIAVNDYEKAVNNLKLIINMPQETEINLGEVFSNAGFDMDLAVFLNQAFANRRDYASVKRTADIKGISLKIKSNMRWPEIDLVATLSSNGIEGNFQDAYEKSESFNKKYYYAGVEVSIPLENSKARSEYDKAKYEKQKAILDIKNTERKIITQVENAYSDVKTLAASIKYTAKTTELARRKLNEEEKRFGYGRSSTKTLIDYQEDLLRAELEEAAYLLKYTNAKIDLVKAANILLPEYEENL